MPTGKSPVFASAEAFSLPLLCEYGHFLFIIITKKVFGFPPLDISLPLKKSKNFILNIKIMSVAKNGQAVKVHYTGRLEDGSVFDSSQGREPLAFTLGNGQMIPGFEEAVLGMSIGEVKEASIPCSQAYGERSNDLILEVPKAQVPADITPEVGMQLAINDGTNSRPVVVSAVDDEKIVLDANHPLAGKDLTFEIELVEIS